MELNADTQTALSSARTTHARTRPRRATSLAALALLASAASHAHLGGFEAADGYAPFLNMVQNYNAGQYGTVCGLGGSQTPITPNTGLWEALAGGFFSGGSVSYATGHSWYDRTWVNSGGTSGAASDQALVLTTGHEGWGGPALKYKYTLDSCDLNGCDPADTAGRIVKVSFWVCAQLAGPELGGQIPNGYFGDEIAFLDSSGNIGFMLGLTQRATGDRVTYWNGSSMFESTIVAANNRYDRWDITLDTGANTISADYYSFIANNTTTVLTNVPMMANMNDFAAMTFRTSPGENNWKLMSVDDFVFDFDCDACAIADVLEVVCELDGSGDITASIKITNNSGVDATRILVTPLPPGAPVSVTPNVINQFVAGTGGMHTFDVTFGGLIDGVEFCFVVTLLDASGNVCCSVVVCITPDCDCLQIRSANSSIVCVPGAPPGTYLYTFQFDNLTPDTIHHMFFFPPSGVTINPNYVALVPPVGPLMTSQSITLMITGATPGEKLYFDIGIHDLMLNECCVQEVCVEIPECDDMHPRGACCFDEPGVPQPICVITTQDDCINRYHGVYLGNNTTCNPNPCLPDPQPTSTHLTAITRCCWPQDQTVTTTLTICNNTGVPRNYSWSLNSVAGAGCNTIIASNFIAPNNGTVTVQPGQCVDIPITIFCEGTLSTPNAMACLEATVTDLASGTNYTSTGKVVTTILDPTGNIPRWCVPVPDPSIFLASAGYANGTFTITNETMFDAIFSYRLISGGVLSVDGRNPGEPVENFVLIPGGQSLPILFAVSLTEERPNEFFDAVLFVETDAGFEPVASQAYTLERTEPCIGDANGDGSVNFADLNTVLGCFGAVGDPGHVLGDLDRNGIVDFGDLNIVLTNFGTSCN
ncbi:MAG: hypothetical protein KF684_03000 [Phycisphaeraceae bacterium]|nr:hypothetical protein [Phycisphaeraceae bacterium]